MSQDAAFCGDFTWKLQKLQCKTETAPSKRTYMYIWNHITIDLFLFSQPPLCNKEALGFQIIARMQIVIFLWRTKPLVITVWFLIYEAEETGQEWDLVMMNLWWVT